MEALPCSGQRCDEEFHIKAGSTSYSYDANGNLTGSSAGMAVSYNAKDQTTRVQAAGLAGAPASSPASSASR